MPQIIKTLFGAILQYTIDLAAAWKHVAQSLLGAIVLILVGVYATTAATVIFMKVARLTAIAGIPWPDLAVVLLGVPLVVFLGQIAFKLVPRAIVLIIALVVGTAARVANWYNGTSALPTDEQVADASEDRTLGRWPADTLY